MKVIPGFIKLNKIVNIKFQLDFCLYAKTNMEKDS
jgi:hypothetical protein